jgi:hypothetical protein
VNRFHASSRGRPPRGRAPAAARVAPLPAGLEWQRNRGPAAPNTSPPAVGSLVASRRPPRSGRRLQPPPSALRAWTAPTGRPRRPGRRAGRAQEGEPAEPPQVAANFSSWENGVPMISTSRGGRQSPPRPPQAAGHAAPRVAPFVCPFGRPAPLAPAGPARRGRRALRWTPERAVGGGKLYGRRPRPPAAEGTQPPHDRRVRLP